MLTTRLSAWTRQRLVALRDDARRGAERGAALINVLLVVMISMVIVVAVSSSVFAANGVTTLTRAGVQAKAAAEAGIDWALAEFNRGYFPCESDQTTSTPSFSLTITYRDAVGATLPCSVIVAGAPDRATINVTGWAELGGTTTSAGNSHEMVAEADITLATSGTVLDQALFSEAGLVLTNNSTVGGSAPGVLDGNIYTNGTFDCHTQNQIQGTVIARGTVNVFNTCTTLESIWTGGNIDFHSSDVNVADDVIVAGSAAINKAHIGGDVVANGNVTMGDQASRNCGSGNNVNVCGSIYSLNGTITQGGNGSPVLGGLFARGNITLSNNTLNPSPAQVTSLNGTLTMNNGRVVGQTQVYGNITNNNASSNIVRANTCSSTVTSANWTTCAANSLVLPYASTSLATFTPSTAANFGTRDTVVSVDRPARTSFPQIFSSSAKLDEHWNGWTRVTVPSTSPACSNGSGFQSAINTIIANNAAGIDLLVLFQCTGKVPGDNVNLTIKGDVALVSPTGFNWGNDTRLASNGGPHSIFLIVPSDAPGVSWIEPEPVANPGQLQPVCAATPAPADISINKFVVNNQTQIFIYSPCTVKIPNLGTGIRGQIYSGRAEYNSGIVISRAIMTVPGVEIPGTPSGGSSITTAVILSRADVG